MTCSVGFLARLRAWNRVTAPVEVRWRFGLEPGTPYAVRVSGGGFGREFYARLQRGGQLTVPPEVLVDEELEIGDLLDVALKVEP
jgi:bifunctional DNA-binding transcriptional regulator/antitoxin component of YhaV-PrlF toxin-antitoxin module